jgi:HlyD family secretion protein
VEGTPMWPRHRPAIFSKRAAGIALFIVVALLALYWDGARASESVDYVTAPVTRGSVTKSISASGMVNPVLTVQVGSYVSGIVQSVSCDFNTRVTKGQVCATIDPRPYETVVAQDRANLATGTAQLRKDQTALDYSNLSFERARHLAAQGLISQDELDSARSAAAEAQAQVSLDESVVSERQASLETAEVNLGYTSITSPVDGTVVSRDVTVGQTVAASFQTPTLFLIANDLSRMQVDASVSESDIGAVRAGDAASFTVDAFPGRSFDGRVMQVRQAPQAVQNVVTYDVVIAVANPDRVLKPGMTASVHIVTDQHNDAVRVPDRALRFVPGGLLATPGAASAGARVWTLRNGRPVPVAVTVGLDDGTNAELTSGAVRPGEDVVVSEAGTDASRAEPAPSRPLRFGA